MEALERQYLGHLLDRTSGNLSETARLAELDLTLNTIDDATVIDLADMESVSIWMIVALHNTHDDGALFGDHGPPLARREAAVMFADRTIEEQRKGIDRAHRRLRRGDGGDDFEQFDGRFAVAVDGSDPAEERTGDGASDMRSTALAVFGKAMTSRIESSPERIAWPSVRSASSS